MYQCTLLFYDYVRKHRKLVGTLASGGASASDPAAGTGTIVSSAIELPYDTSGSVLLDAFAAWLLPANGGSQPSSRTTRVCRGSRPRAYPEHVRRRRERTALQKLSGNMFSRAGWLGRVCLLS